MGGTGHEWIITLLVALIPTSASVLNAYLDRREKREEAARKERDELKREAAEAHNRKGGHGHRA